MSRGLTLLFAIIAYAIFFATFLYLICFVGSLPFVPVTVDSGGPMTSGRIAAVIDVALIALFGLQHSVMARQGFKRAWTKIVPWPMERSVFVLFASIALLILFWFWHPIPRVIWDARPGGLRTALWAIFGLGWLVVLLSTFLINHFELFGLQQAWLHARGRQSHPPQLREPFLYKYVRHPLYLGFFLAFWSIPKMTAGHLLLSLGVSAFMLIAIQFEERDLITLFGKDYEDYQGRVGMLAPRLRR
jgi:protein-S-isoprenylcysteine O-methyltransferase Ste14